MNKEINFFVLNSNEELVATLSSGDTGKHTPVLQASVDEKLDSYDVLTLQIPADDENAGKLREDSYIIFEDIKGWREYIVTAVEDVDGDSIVSTVTAELSSIELLDEVLLQDYLVDSKEPERLLADALEGTRWQVGYVDESLYNSSFNDNVKYMNVLEAIDQLSSKFSAEVAFSYSIDGNKISDRFVNFYKQIGQNSGKRFEVDKDVSEITRTIDTTGIKTAIIAYGKEPEEAEEGQPTPERLTIENVEWSVANGDPTDKPLGQPFIEDTEALEKWGKLNADGSRRNRFMTMEIDAETEAQIASMAWVSLGRYTEPKLTYEATVLDLFSLTGDEDYTHEKVNLGDTVVIIDNYFTSPLMIQTRIVEMVRDLLEPISNELVLGDSKQTFKVGDVKQSVEDLESRVSQATYKANYAQLTGGGVYAYGGSQEPAEPIEGDIWFRPHPTVIGAKQLLRYTGTLWNVELDTSVVDAVEDLANEAGNQAKTAKETADGAVSDAQSAIDRAEDSITHTDEEVKRIEESFNVRLTGKVDGETLTSEITAVKGLLQNKVNSSTFTSFRTQTEQVLQDKVSSTDFESYQTQTDRAINLRVKSGEVVNQINISDENILIDGNKLHITALTTIEDAVITSAMIKDLSVDKLLAGTIDAEYHNVINLTADNITGGDLNVKNVRIMNGEIPVMQVDGATNELTLNVSKMTINTMDVAEEIEATRDHADTVADTALDSAKGYADSTAGTTLTTAKAHADAVAKAEADLAEVATKAYTDEMVTAEEQRAILDATEKLTEAKNHAVTVADTAESDAKAHADTVAKAEADLAVVEANAYSDGIVTAEEQRAIADAEAKLTIAQEYALGKANTAESNAKIHADTVADAEANLALVEAKAYADNIITAEEERAIADAKSVLADAKAHADSVAGTAEDNAKTHADSKATTAETNAKAHADSVAKAESELAETEAKAHADTIVSAEEQRAIADATTKLTEAKNHAVAEADTAETNAKTHADTVAKAEAELAETEAKAHADTIVTAEETRAIADAKAKLTEAQNYAKAQADSAESSAKTHANNVAVAEADLALTTAKAYADGIISTEEERAIEDAKAVLAEAKAHAITVADKAEADAKTHANSQATTAENNAKKHADNVAVAKANLAETEAKAYADGIVTAEEQRAIADSNAKLTTAKNYAKAEADSAETSAKGHADSKASTAETNAKNHANSKASTAETNAKNYAEEQVDNVKIGGVNLIDNGDFSDGLGAWKTSSDTVEVDDYTLAYPILRLTNTFGGDPIEAEQIVNVEPSSEYTVSFNNTRNADVYLVELKADGTATATYRENHMSVNGSYTQFTKTITTMADTGQLRVILRGPAGHNPFFYRVQLEEGNKATAFNKSENDRIRELNNGLATKADGETVDELATELSDFQTVTASAEELGEIVASLNEYRELLEANDIGLEQATEDITTLLSRTDAITNNLGAMSESWGFVDSYMTVGNEGLVIGQANGNTAIRISDDRIDFMDGSGEPVAFITNQVMQINRGIFVQSLTVGEHKVETIEGGHTIFTWVS